MGIYTYLLYDPCEHRMANNILSCGGSGSLFVRDDQGWGVEYLNSDYNNWHGPWAFQTETTWPDEYDLAAWQAAFQQDQNSISVDPLFWDPSNGDFHLKSPDGRYDPDDVNADANGFVYYPGEGKSPCLDAGDPTSDFSAELAPNGGRINLGAYGGTAEASKATGPPSLVSTLPQDGAANVHTLTGISLSFGKPMDTTSVESSFVMRRDGTPVAGTWSWQPEDMVGVFTPDQALAFSTQYTVVVGEEAEDTAGYPLAGAPHTFSFTTLAEPAMPVVAQDDWATIWMNEQVTLDVLANDSGPAPLSVAAFGGNPYGNASAGPDGTVTYTPSPNWRGLDDFTYTTQDGYGRTATATVTVYVGPVEIHASDGEEGDQFGYSVAASGDTVVVGAPESDNQMGWRAGSAYVFQRLAGDTWQQTAKLVASDGTALDRFGRSVAVSGDIVVGAPDAYGLYGAAYVFSPVGAVWSEDAVLWPDQQLQSRFGRSAAISGDTLAIAAYSGYGPHLDRVYVYERVELGWQEQARLPVPGGVTNVAISGDVLAAGACGEANSGIVYVFTRDGGTWTQQTILTNPDGQPDDFFGASSVAASGDTIVTGAFNDDSVGVDAGSAYVFVRENGNWVQQAWLSAPDGDSGDKFGKAVAISGDVIVVGAHCSDAKGLASGSAYLFMRSSGSWLLKAVLTAPDGKGYDWFGESVAISGRNFVVGARGSDDKGSLSGSAYVFRLGESVDAQDDAATCEENGSVTIDLLANDRSALNIVAVTNASHGEVVDNSDGTVTYTPESGFIGQDSFGYAAADVWGGVDDATVTVTVEALPPCVASAVPGDATGVPIWTPIIIGFSRSMNTASAEGAFSLTLVGSGSIAGTTSWSSGDSIMVFVPDNWLVADGADYEVKIADTALDDRNVGLDGDKDGASGGDYSFTFTTGPWLFAGAQPPSGGAGILGVDLTRTPDTPYINKVQLETGVDFTVDVTSGAVPGATFDFGLTGMETAFLQPDNSYTFHSVPLPAEGPNIVVATVVDSEGNTGGATMVVMRDTTPPEISVTKPFQHTSNDWGKLYVGPDDLELVTEATEERRRRFVRNVIGKDTPWQGVAVDALSGLDAVSVRRHFDIYASGPLDLELMADQGLGLAGEKPHEIVCPEVGRAGDDEDAADRTYTIAFRATDRAQNEAVYPVVIELDLTPPNVSPPAQEYEPFVGIYADDDTVSLRLGTEQEKVYRDFSMGGYRWWVLPGSLAPCYADKTTTQLYRGSIPYSAEDYAGNKSPADSTFLHWVEYMHPLDVQQYGNSGWCETTVTGVSVDAYCLIRPVGLGPYPFTEDQMATTAPAFTATRDDLFFEGPTDPILGLSGAELELSGGKPIVLHVRNSAVGIGTTAYGTGLDITGTFPHLKDFSSRDKNSITFPEGATNGRRYVELTLKAGPLEYTYTRTDEWDLTGEGEDSYTQTGTAPGWAGDGSFTIQEPILLWKCNDYPPPGWWSWPGYQRALFNWETNISWQGDGQSGAALGSTSAVEAPRFVNVLVLSPDTVRTGDRATLYIQGGFPEDDWDDPDDLVIELDIQPHVEEGDPPPPAGAVIPTLVTEPGLEPRVVAEKLCMATVWRSVEFYLDVPDDALLGLYDITVTCKKVTQPAVPAQGIEEEYEGVDAYVMEEVLNILKMEIVSPVYDSDGIWTGELEEKKVRLASDPIPTVELEPVGNADVAIASDGALSVTFTGTIRDDLADIALPKGKADIPTATVIVNGEEAGTIDLQWEQDGVASLIRPCPRRAAQFTRTVTFPAITGTNTVVVETAQNAAGNKGCDTIEVDVIRELLESTASNAPVLLGIDEGTMVFNIYVAQDFDPTQLDSIKFYLGDRGPTEDDPDYTEADMLTFTSSAPPLPATVSITAFGGLTPGTDTLTAVVDIVMDGVATLSIDGTFTEQIDSPGRFSFALDAASLAYNVCFDSPPAAGTYDDATFYLGNRDAAPTDPQLAEVDAPDSLRFSGVVTDLGTVTADLQEAPALDVDVQEVVVASISIETANGTVTFEGPIEETTASSGRFFYLALGETALGVVLVGGLQSQMLYASPEVYATWDVPGYGGGHMDPFLVRVRFADGTAHGNGRLYGTYFEYVDNPHDPTDEYKYFGHEGSPVVFGAMGYDLTASGNECLNLSHQVGEVSAQLVGSPVFADKKFTNARVDLLRFSGPRDSYAASITSAEWERRHAWEDIKLLSTTENVSNEEDKYIHIVARLRGLASGDDPDTAELDVLLFRTNTERFQMALPQSTESVALQRHSFTDPFIGSSITEYRGSLELPSSLVPSTADDEVPEVAAIDRQVSRYDSRYQKEAEQDAWCFSRGLAKKGYIIRGVAHPGALGVPGESINPNRRMDDEQGNWITGRPNANIEFVAAAGVERIVVSPYKLTPKDTMWTDIGRRGYYDRNMDFDHLLVRSPADIFYGSGGGGDRNQGRVYVTQQAFVEPSGWTPSYNDSHEPNQQFGPSDDDEAQRPSHYYNGGDNVALKPWQCAKDIWTDEIEWTIWCGSVACGFDGKVDGWITNVVNRKNWNGRYSADLRPGLKWARALIEVHRGHGILGFAGNGWAGEGAVGAFLKKAEAMPIADAWVVAHDFGGKFGVPNNRTSYRPVTALVASEFRGDTIQSVKDNNRTQSGLNVLLACRMGYGQIYAHNSREEVFSGIRHNYIWYDETYNLAGGLPPKFPSGYEPQMPVAEQATPRFAQEGITFRVDGYSDRIDIWRSWVDFWGNEEDFPPGKEGLDFDYEGQLASVGGTATITWPASEDPDNEGETCSYQVQVFDVLDPRPGNHGITDYPVDFGGPIAGSPSDWLTTNSLDIATVGGLVAGELYAIRVRARDSTGRMSNWSPLWVFKR